MAGERIPCALGQLAPSARRLAHGIAGEQFMLLSDEALELRLGQLPDLPR